MTAVIWIDWYPYHIARLRALGESAVGIELVGGAGVHRQMFRSERRAGARILTLLPEANWHDAGRLALAAAVWKRLSRIAPSAVFVPGYDTLPALAAALWGKLHRRRTVLMTESSRTDHPRSPGKEALKRTLLSLLFDRAIAGGKPQARYLRELGFAAERIAQRYDVVDNAFYAEHADRARSSGRPPAFSVPEDYFLYAGRLSPEKNVDGLVRGYAAYRRRGGRSSLVIAGDGPAASLLKEQARNSGFGADICFVGMKTADELGLYYAFARCFILPSTREPWGLVVNEAMAAGLPVIVSIRCGCVEDLVRHGKNGLIVAPDRPGELCDAMLWIDADPARRQAMGQESRRIIAQYSPEAWAAEVARVVAT